MKLNISEETVVSHRKNLLRKFKASFAAFPDLKIITDVLLAERNKVVKVWTANLTHKGEIMGIPATGKAMVPKGIEVLRIEDGKIAEIWICKDNLGMMKQPGVFPLMGE